MNPTNNVSSKVNKLQGEYLSSNLNQVWTIDVTSIKQKYYFFFILDLASRRVVYHDVSNHDYSAAEATHILVKALMEENSVEPPRHLCLVFILIQDVFFSQRNGLNV